MGVPTRALLLGATAVLVVRAEPEGIRAGTEEFLNRDFAAAERAAEEVLQALPDSLDGHLLLAKARLHAEMVRLRLAGTRAFRGDRPYNSRPRPKPDTGRVRKVLEIINRGFAACERRLAADGGDVQALHALAQLYALRSVHELMLQKAPFKALSSGRTASRISYQVGELRPEFADGLLVAGVYEYMVGSLPWAVRAIVALRGHRGSRMQGWGLISRAAHHGEVLRSESHLLLALVERKEKRYSEAADLFLGLLGRYPRAYYYELEAADLRESAGQRDAALALFRSARRKREQSVDAYERIPPAMAAALDRRIGVLERQIARRRGLRGRGTGGIAGEAHRQVSEGRELVGRPP